MWAMTEELQFQTCFEVSPIRHCVLTYVHNLKSTVVYEPSTYWTIALLSETFIVWFRIAWEIWLESYGPKTCLTVVLWYNIVCVLQAEEKNRGAFNSTILQSTPWLLRMILLVLKVAKQSQSANYGPIHVSLFGVQPWLTTELRLWLYYTLMTALYTANNA